MEQVLCTGVTRRQRPLSILICDMHLQHLHSLKVHSVGVKSVILLHLQRKKLLYRRQIFCLVEIDENKIRWQRTIQLLLLLPLFYLPVVVCYSIKLFTTFAHQQMVSKYQFVNLDIPKIPTKTPKSKTTTSLIVNQFLQKWNYLECI